jgi:predicted peptidase
LLYHRAARRAAVVLFGLLSLPLAGCKSGEVVRSTQRFPRNTGFQEHRFTVNGVSRTLWVFVPAKYTPSQRMPAVLFLHGLFEAGRNGDKVLGAGLAPVIADTPENWPFITIFPQSPGDWRGEEPERIALAALDFAERRWSIDRERVILAGLSYGGLGVWEIGSRHPDRFAALVPVSGHANTNLVDWLVWKPVWAFSSRDDLWVKSHNSQEMVRMIDSRGGRARWTEFKGNTHDCWASAVFGSKLVDWMLQQKRVPRLSAAGPARALVLPLGSNVK